MITTVDEAYVEDADGMLVARSGVTHRDDEYESAGFEFLLKMQESHFWYQGRHRFLLHAVRKYGPLLQRSSGKPRLIDLGGGCGGWVRYLADRIPGVYEELAIGDSSPQALQFARDVVGQDVRRYQIDLMQLGWTNRWDGAFLLDVLEHLPHDVEALQQIAAALRPGGLLFVTTPALEAFRSYNDEFAHHVHRYSTADFARLADAAGLQLVDARYFMFFLSPLLIGSRWLGPDVNRMTAEEIRAHVERTHRTPAAPVNRLLSWVFACETPLGHQVRFPWGTSILGVFRRPAVAATAA